MALSGSVLAANAAIERWARWDEGALTRINAYWKGVLDNDPSLKSTAIQTCVEIVFGDAVVRVATGPVRSTSSRTGEVVAYADGLTGDIDLDYTMSLDAQQANARSVSITLPSELVNPYDLISRGRTLGGIAEISLQLDGMDYDNRFVLLRGDVLSPSFGAPGEFVGLTIADPRMIDSALVPPVAADATRWPNIGNGAVGKRYPLLLNGYDKIPCLPVYSVVPSPGKWLVCGGRGFGTPTVYVNGVAKAAGDGTYPWSKVETIDALGEPVVLIDFTSGAATWADNDVVHATITTDATSGDAQVGVIAAIRNLLRGYTSLGSLGLNPDLFADAEGRMPAWRPRAMINGSGESAAKAIDFVENELLASFPMVRMVYEGRGLGPVVIDRRRGATDGSLVGGRFPLRERVSLVQETSKSELFNAFEVQYGYDLIANDYTGIARLDRSNSAVCKFSASRDVLGGDRPATPLESPYISAQNVAEGVLAWQAAHLALPAYYVEWTAEPWAFFRWRRGMNVSYTDDRVGFSGAVATILRLSYSRRGSTIGLLVWHPFWDEDMTGSV